MQNVPNVLEKHVEHLVDNDGGSIVQRRQSSQTGGRIPECRTKIDRVWHAQAEPGIVSWTTASQVVVPAVRLRHTTLKDDSAPPVQLPRHGPEAGDHADAGGLVAAPYSTGKQWVMTKKEPIKFRSLFGCFVARGGCDIEQCLNPVGGVACQPDRLTHRLAHRRPASRGRNWWATRRIGTLDVENRCSEFTEA